MISEWVIIIYYLDREQRTVAKQQEIDSTWTRRVQFYAWLMGKRLIHVDIDDESAENFR